jgi:hypothetical protein
MAIQAVPQKFRASDGREFVTQREAERHERLITAETSYRDSRRAFGRALAQTQKTADGALFDFDRWTYIALLRPFGQLPRLREVRFYGFAFDFDDRDDCFTIMQDEGEGQHRYRASYRIDELYTAQAAADVALLAAQEEWLAEQTEQVASLRRAIYGDESR